MNGTTYHTGRYRSKMKNEFDGMFLFSQVSLLFEGENLAQASPATVSRCGMVYNDYTDLGWKPFVQSWLDKRHKVPENNQPPPPKSKDKGVNQGGETGPTVGNPKNKKNRKHTDVTKQTQTQEVNHRK